MPLPSAKLKSCTSALLLLVTDFGAWLTERTLSVGALLPWLRNLLLPEVSSPLLWNKLFSFHVLFLSLEKYSIDMSCSGDLPPALCRAGQGINK